MIYTDAHNHLQNMPNRDDEIHQAMAADVAHFICNATQESDWATVLDLAARYMSVQACVGVHPWFVQTVREGWLERLEDVLRAHPHVMVGEIGLDKTRDNLSQQESIFTAQLNLARRYSRIAHLHCVHAEDKMLSMMRKHQRPFLLHRFSGDKIEQWTALGAYFSFAQITDKVATVPLDRVLLESDAPSCFAPKYIAWQAKKGAQMLGMDLESFAAQLEKNRKALMNE